MATAKKLPSGSWRCQVFSHFQEQIQPDGTVKKKRIYKSFTCDDPSTRGKRKCEAEAAAWAADKEQFSGIQSIDFGDAMDNYINSRENVLSPRTISEYRKMRKRYCKDLMEKKIDLIAQDDVQKAINYESLTHSPKTVRNIHGLISATFKAYRPEFALNTALPKKKRVDLYIPTDNEIKQLLDFVKGTEMELPILLAAFGPMRRGEICALESDDISGSIVHVNKNMVLNQDLEWIIKTPKSYAGDRFIDFPNFVAKKWQGIHGRIVDLNPDVITKRFEHCLKGAGLPHFRFHDLRHYSASIQHALGVPDAYIMQRGGWSNDGVLKAVYRHALSDKAKEYSDIANNHFNDLCNTKCNTKNKKP